MASKLHELLAVISDKSNVAKNILEEAMVTFSRRADHFKGQVRSVTFLDEARSGENGVDIGKEMVTTVDEKIKYVNESTSRAWDALLQLEDANTRAKADLVFEGTTIAKNLPATFLLGMESRLKAYRNIIAAAPTLEPSMKWELDPDAGDGVYRAAPVLGFKTEKTIKVKTLAKATKEHAEQVTTWNEDVPVARVETIHTSGMISPARKSQILRKTDQMISAVKKARQRANCVEVVNLKIADDMFNVIFN